MFSLLLRPIRFAALTLAMVAAISMLLPAQANDQAQAAADVSGNAVSWQPPSTPAAHKASISPSP